MDEGPGQAGARLSAALEAQLLRRLGVEWRAINYRHFKGALRPPVLTLIEGSAQLARWSRPLRTLELARAGVTTHAWADILEAIKREAVWQYIDDRLRVDPRNRHPTYRRICRSLGIESIDPGDAARARPVRSAAGESERRVISRIHKLFALARSPNRHEAETAATTARRLMFKFNIERAQAETRTGPDDDERGYAYRHLGRPRGPLHEHDRRLATILTGYFFVHSAWLPVYLPREGKRAVILEICGLEANLLMAEHVHDFLRQTTARLWAEYRAQTPGAVPGDRRAYAAGVMSGFEAKLARQDERLEQQGLVWVPAEGLGQYFRRRHPGVAYTHVGGGPRGQAYEQGSRAGAGIVLSQPVAQGRRRGPPRALGPG